MVQRHIDREQELERRQMPRRLAHPRRLDIFLHLFKTLKLIGAVLWDRRVFVGRKLIFGIAVLAMLIVLAFPDLLVDLGLSFAVPIVGTVLGVPLDAGLDWTIFALAVVSLLRVFPAEIVSEHYEHLFTPRWHRRRLA